MAHLLLTVDGVEQIFQLKGAVRIGRHPENDIQVLDAQVSKRHCEIEEHAAGWVLRDLGTLNGTFVNGERVRGETLLCHRDLIRVGSATLGFNDSDEPSAAQSSPESRPAVSPVATTSAGGELELKPAERDQLLREYLRRIVGAPSRGRLHEIVLAALLAIGEADAGVVLARPDGAAIESLDGLEVLQWIGRGRELPSRPEWAEHAERALKTGSPTVISQPRDDAYRPWQPRSTLIVALGHAARRFALVAIECPGEESRSLADVELCARVAGAVLAALTPAMASAGNGAA